MYIEPCVALRDILNHTWNIGLERIDESFYCLVLVANYDGVYPLNEQQLHEWAVLDTFDWLAPPYDKPQTLRALRLWLSETGLENLQVL